MLWSCLRSLLKQPSGSVDLAVGNPNLELRNKFKEVEIVDKYLGGKATERMRSSKKEMEKAVIK